MHPIMSIKTMSKIRMQKSVVNRWFGINVAYLCSSKCPYYQSRPRHCEQLVPYNTEKEDCKLCPEVDIIHKTPDGEVLIDKK